MAPVLSSLTFHKIAIDGPEHPKVQVEITRDNVLSSSLVTSQIHMDHADLGFSVPCLKLQRAVIGNIVRSAS